MLRVAMRAYTVLQGNGMQNTGTDEYVFCNVYLHLPCVCCVTLDPYYFIPRLVCKYNLRAFGQEGELQGLFSRQHHVSPFKTFSRMWMHTKTSQSEVGSLAPFLMLHSTLTVFRLGTAASRAIGRASAWWLTHKHHPARRGVTLRGWGPLSLVPLAGPLVPQCRPTDRTAQNCSGRRRLSRRHVSRADKDQPPHLSATTTPVATRVLTRARPQHSARTMVAFARAAAAVVGGWLLAGAAAAIAHERFVAVETGAVLSPRMYRMSPAQPLGKRQDGCDSGSHPCACCEWPCPCLRIAISSNKRHALTW